MTKKSLKNYGEIFQKIRGLFLMLKVYQKSESSKQNRQKILPIFPKNSI